jgi:Ca2+-binding RTX toxin-like protein
MAFIKHFDVSLGDLGFLMGQVSFSTIKLVRYDSSGNAIYGYVNEAGVTIELGQEGNFDPLAGGVYGSSRVADGLRNVNGLFNNLTNRDTSDWGSVNQSFIRLVPSDYGHYTQTRLGAASDAYWGAMINWTASPADYSNHSANVVDYTPRMISQTVDSSNIFDPLHGADSAMATAIANGLEVETRTFVASDGAVHDEAILRNLNSVALDPSLSGWNTLFGQFFDHGLDFIDKPGAGVKIKISLAPNDPLYRAPDLAHGDPGNTSITITRATIASTAAMGPEYTNHDTPYIDQNQTYGGDVQITNLLREWVKDASGTWVPGASLLDGHQTVAYHSDVFSDAGAGMTTRTLPTLTELRAALTETGRADLSWEDIANYRMRDAHGQLLDTDAASGMQTRGTGQAIVLDMNPRIDAAHITASAVGALNTAFGTSFATNFTGANVLSVGALIQNGWINPSDFSITPGLTTAQHNAVGEILLEAIGDHYIAGDGRVNENFGLTAMHHVFHEDHNVQLAVLETNILSQDVTTRHGWQVQTAFTDAAGNYLLAANAAIAWNQDKLFEATKLIVEMEYQHVAIDQYARRITPDLPEFVTYDSNINADISLEFAQAAFRFGHSQLREAIDTLDPSNTINSAIQHFLLKDAFLNPADFAAVGAGAIALGMTRQVSNEIDEFVTPALQQTLLGQSLDLAAINIARGRDLGLPTLNETRKALYDALVAERADPHFNANGPHAKLQLDLLRPYNSWNEFGANLVHPESLVNFIAAYSFDGDRAHAQAILDADALGALQTYSSTFTDSAGNSHTVSGTVTVEQSTAFLSGALGSDGSFVEQGADGFDKIDLWLGGIAESHVIGGVLGSTFNAIFEDQMERLMDGDRFYYLYRLNLGLAEPTDLNAAVTTEQFKDIIERTTGVTHLTGDVMSYADDYVDLSKKLVAGGAPLMNSDGSERLVGGATVDETMQNAHKYGDIIDQFAADHNGFGVYSSTGRGTGANGSTIMVTNPEDHSVNAYILDQRPNSDVENSNGNPTYGYNSHEVLVGTSYNDFLDSGDGDDTLYGDEGDDILIGNGGGDHVYGGDGNDVIFGGGGTAGADVEDFLDGGDGNDTIYGGQNNGAVEVLVGGDGNDHLYGESGIEEITADRGDDVIDAGSDTDLVFAGAGNDYLFGGEGPDELQGQTGDDILDGGTGTDKLLGGVGDDIFFGGIGGGAVAGDSDELIGDAGVNAATSVDSSFDLADYSDLSGRLDVAADLRNQNLTAAAGATPFQPFNQLYQDINGVVGTGFDDQFAISANNATGAGLIGDDNGNWLIGGSGNDILQGNGGNDVIVGGSIRLDKLDGTYSLAGAPDPYSSVVDTATDRANPNSVLTGGFLGLAALQQGGQALFASHFTELLKSAAYKDFVLGDSAADATSSAGSDTVVLAGNRADYSVTLLTSTGAVATSPANVYAVKITDNGSGARSASDGTDLLIGIDNLRFADGTRSVGQLFNSPATGTIDFAASSATIGGSGNNGTPVARLSPVSFLFDGDNATAANPSGAVTIPATGYQWQTSSNGGSSWTNIATGGGVNQQNSAEHALSLGATSGTLVRLLGSYTDLAGNAESATSAMWNAIVGTNSGQTLNGNASTAIGDLLFGLGGNDTLNGGVGDDRLVGGGGNDSLNGGDGTDRAMFTSGIGSYTFALGASAALLVDGPNADGTDTLTGVEELQFGSSAYHLVQGTNGNDDPVSGTAAADLLLGFNGNDVLTGAAGNDALDGGAGNDRFFATIGDGNDSYDGGSGTDSYDLSATTAAATVNLAAGSAASSDIGSDTLSNIENVTGGGGADTITAGSGQNNLLGGLGSDRFIFASTGSAGNGGSRDSIGDFVTSAANTAIHDVLDLSGIDANTATNGNQAFIWDSTAIANGNHARGHVGYHYETIGGVEHTIIEGNTSSNTAGHNFQIDLIGHLVFDTGSAGSTVDLFL